MLVVGWIMVACNGAKLLFEVAKRSVDVDVRVYKLLAFCESRNLLIHARCRVCERVVCSEVESTGSSFTKLAD